MKELELISKDSSYIPQPLKDINFFLFAGQYLSSYRCKDVRMIQHSIDKFKKCVQNDKIKISEITTDLMLCYKDYLIYDAGLTGETHHNYFTRFKKVLKSAKVKGYFDQLPIDEIKFSKQRRNDTIKKEVLTAEEIQRLANVCEVDRVSLNLSYTVTFTNTVKNKSKFIESGFGEREF